MTAYYNEIDPFAAQWLRNLITAGHIAPGEVDERDIWDVSPDDLRPYTQCHFFAGIGGWSYALRLAGWPDDQPVWTGSCPCQPFSQAGKGKGTADERHLWPAWFHLISQCRPSIIFGEQVEAAIQHGWLDLVSTDLEKEDYAVGAAILPAACVEAPHGRHRLWFVGLSNSARPFSRSKTTEIAGHGDSALTTSQLDRALGYAEGDFQWQCRIKQESLRWKSATRGSGAWSSLDWLPCRDGKYRPTQPGLFPLAHGISGRVGRLRAYGNAIVPQVAEEFIKAYREQ